MGLTKEQSIAQYGTESYTAWDEAGAFADAKSKGIIKTSQNFNQYLSDVSAKDLQTAVSVPYTTNANANYINGLNGTVANTRIALDQNIIDNRTQVQKQLDDARNRENGALDEIKGLTTPFREETEKKQREELGVNEVLSEQRGLLGELEQLLTEGNELIKQQKGVTGLASIRNPRIQKTMDDITGRAGVINAVVSLQNTYLANAYTSIDRSIKAISQDRQDRIGYYQTVLSLANRDIISLTTEDRRLAKEQTDLLKSDYEREQKTVDYIKGLMTNPDTALALAQSGVSLNDSVETINQKLGDYQYSQDVREQSNKFTSAGGVLVTDPSTVPAGQLKSFTDSRGKVHYYKMPLTKDTINSTGANDWLNNQLKGNGTNSKISSIPDKAPTYSPSGGAGSVYINPANGSIWQYTNSGWKKIV
jgi:hypothetical protein